MNRAGRSGLARLRPDDDRVSQRLGNGRRFFRRLPGRDPLGECACSLCVHMRIVALFCCVGPVQKASCARLPCGPTVFWMLVAL